ncbi:CoA-binding protein [Pseudokineococcus sp. 1T1Z-3]|uniref:CoA-binding protein n=1 Tax=Pseudokineococcus sp. 1T1Z-3 TaxID=3132745 RepID=UPI0030AFA07A
MTPHRNDDAVMRRLLTEPGRWAVVGLSNDESRPAFGVARFLQEELGVVVVPVHPRAEDVHGEHGVPDLDAAAEHGTLDVVDCFVGSARVGAVVDDAIRLGARAVWLQVGVVDEDAAARAATAGLDVVMDTCPAIEAPRLGLL